MTTSNILSLPFRKSTQISISNAIQQYISKKYDQHPEMFRHDLEVIDSLRHNAVNVREPHEVGIKRLTTYAGQLVWMGAKFPIDIGVGFTWYPSLGYHTERPLVQDNLKFELMNILYNLAALYSQLGVASKGNMEQIRTSANYFALAAGVLSHIKTQVLPELRMASPPDDMDEWTLESLTQLFLAQSQECFWHKAVNDKYKDMSIAKLAARVSDLYNLAGEAAMKSEAVSSAWIHHMSAKHHHFAAAAQYRAALDCLEKRKYGEEVARLADSVACVNEGLKECKGGYLSKAVVEDLNGLKRKVEEDLKRAEKDNDVIYLQAVPSKSELRLLDRANMATVRVPPQVANPHEYIGEQGELGPPLFSKLVPFAVHQAASIYEERRDRLVNNNIIAELESLTVKLHETTSGLGLPGSLQAFEKPLGLPGTLVQHAEELRQADALVKLEASFADIEKLRGNDLTVFEEGKALLAAEEEEDARFRRKHGTQRWTRPESRADASENGGAHLWKQAAEIDGYLASSTSSDGVVREKYQAVQSTLAVLAGSDRVLLDFIPNSRRKEMPEAVRPALGRLRGAYGEMQRFESRRRKRVEALSAKARADDVKADILNEAARLERTFPGTQLAAAHFEDFFDKRLDALYEPDIAAVEKERADQERLLGDVQRANRDFEAQKRSSAAGGGPGAREREQALQRLDNAYYKYKELVSNLEVGRKFYNDLSQIVGQFRDRARAWVNERRQDAKGLEDEISMPPLSSLSLNHQYHPQSPPVQTYRTPAPNPPPNPYYSPPRAQPQQRPQQQPQLHPQPQPQPIHSHIQSWADSVLPPQQPQPIPAPQPIGPMANVGTSSPAPPGLDTIWAPNMGIKFAPGAQPQAARQQGGGGNGAGNGNGTPAGGTWDPSHGIRFG